MTIVPFLQQTGLWGQALQSILLKKSFWKNNGNIFRSQMPYNQFSQHG